MGGWHVLQKVFCWLGIYVRCMHPFTFRGTVKHVLLAGNMFGVFGT